MAPSHYVTLLVTLLENVILPDFILLTSIESRYKLASAGTVWVSLIGTSELVNSSLDWLSICDVYNTHRT